MDQGNEIFGNDYKALQQRIAYYPGISIVSVDKEPPEQYVIEYRLFGYGYDASGQVQMQRRHRIEINLPFGYPHFPPTVKPLTKICHPDVAEHAVRIAEFWQSHHSLADLVIHIGDMIRGAVYSTEGAFNEEAAAWYEANREKLPLGELEYNDPNVRVEKAKSESTISYKRVGIVGAIAIVIVCSGLLVRDKLILGKNIETIQQIQNLLVNRQFSEAQEIGRNAVDALQGVLFFAGDRTARLTEVTTILQSEQMKEGLAGRIEYKGKYVPIPVADTLARIDRLSADAAAALDKKDIQAAQAIFQNAITLAEKNGLSEVADGVRRIAAEKRLLYFVDQANVFYSEEQWQQAVEFYDSAIALLANEKAYLSAESLENREKLVKLKILAQASVEREEAVKAEKTKKYDIAAERYRSIVSLIQTSEYRSDPVLAKVGSDADVERQRLAELALVAEGSAYLTENYKTIFLEHYPGLYEPGLQSPRVRYLGRNDGKLVFVMSCIELVQRNTNEFRLNYQFDPFTRKWSIYREGQ